MSLKTLTTQRRSAMTLVELLVVITILVMLVGVLLPMIQPAMEGREIREAARQINSYLTAAQTRAVAQGREVGVMFLRSPSNTGTCFQLAMCKAPPPYTGEFADARAFTPDRNGNGNFDEDRNYVQLGPVSSVRPLFANGADDEQNFVRPGDTITLNYRRPAYTITGPDPMNLLRLQLEGTTPQIISAPGVAFQIQRAPRRTSEALLELPNGTCIDLDLSGFEGESASIGEPINAHSSLWNDPSNPPQFGPIPLFDRDPVGGADYPVMVTFSPSGGVKWIYRSIGTATGFNPTRATRNIYFLIGRPNQVAPDNGTAIVNFLADTNSNDRVDFFEGLSPAKTNAQEARGIWVTINARTGNVTTAPSAAIDLTKLPPEIDNNPASANEQAMPSFLAYLRRFAASSLGIGGR